MYSPSLPFDECLRFLAERGFRRSESLDDIPLKNPFILLLPDNWRHFHKDSLHPYLPAFARVEMPTAIKACDTKGIASPNRGQVDYRGNSAYFGLIGCPPDVIKLSSTYSEIKTRTINSDFCYTGRRELLDEHFPLGSAQPNKVLSIV